MIKIAGCWDIWSDSYEEYNKQWQFILHSQGFAVDKFCMTPNTGVGIRLKEDSLDKIQRIFEFESMQQVIDSNSDCVPIVVDEYGSTDLVEYIHPQNALYIFGRTGKSFLEELNWTGQSLHVKNAAGEQAGFLHPHQAACIVLYDRMVKQWQ
jgi:hypothetical protein